MVILLSGSCPFAARSNSQIVTVALYRICSATVKALLPNVPIKSLFLVLYDHYITKLPVEIYRKQK